MSLFNNNVMGYGSMARKYGEYAAYYPHYDSFGSPNSPSPGSTGVGGSSSGSNSTHHLSQSPEVGAWPSHELSHVQHSMSNYYPHHPAFLPTHHGPTARDFREAAAAQVSLTTEFQREVLEKHFSCSERQIKTAMLRKILELPIEQLWSPILIGLINFFNF